MKALVDTNIIVRSVQRSHPHMRLARTALRKLYEQGYELCVTQQNVVEFWNACTRPTNVNGLGHSIAEADRLTSHIETLFTLLPDSLEAFHVWRQLVVLHEVRGVKVHDTRLVAVMQVYGVTHLLTFNEQDFKRFEKVITINPASLV